MNFATLSSRAHHVRNCAESRSGRELFTFARTDCARSLQDTPHWPRWIVSFNRDRRARSGFTLIELLVTIAIIATLAAIVAPSLFGNIGEARKSTARSQIQILALALDAYRLDNDGF